MPSKGPDKSRRPHGSGAHRTPPKTHVKVAAPTGESTKESGAPRLYAPPGSARSTASHESGPRRLYVSPALHLNPAAGRAVKPR